MAEPLTYGSVAESHVLEGASYRGSATDAASAEGGRPNGGRTLTRVLAGAGVVAACVMVAASRNVSLPGALSHATAGAELESSAHTKREKTKSQAEDSDPAKYSGGDTAFGFGAHTRHEEKKSIGDYHNDTEWSGQNCYPGQVDDTSEYFTCPAGLYLGRSVEEKSAVNQRLRKLYNKLRQEYHFEENKRENTSGSSYLARGYATYESMVWPKPGYCQELANDTWINTEWSATYNGTEMTTKHVHHNYKADAPPGYIHKYSYGEPYDMEFHLIWKVASTSFPSYLSCEYGSATLTKKDVDERIPDGYKVAAAVRNPLGRWVSAVCELLQRAVNGYCPTGYCTASDYFYGNYTLELYKQETTWYKLVEHGVNMSALPELVGAFLHDVECNYEFYAADHFITQSAFINQGGGCMDSVDVVVRLEELDAGLDSLTDQTVTKKEWVNCSLGDDNSADDKPSGVPSESAIMEVLEGDDELMQKLCLVLAQDLLCFDYDLPDACVGMF